MGVVQFVNQDNFTILFALAAYAFAAVFSFAGWRLQSVRRRQLDSALTAKGVVTSLETSISMGSDMVDRPLFPAFTFTAQNGVQYHVRSICGTFPATHKVGDVVEVFYQPTSPQEAIIDPHGSFVETSRICFFAAGLAALVASVMIVFGR